MSCSCKRKFAELTHEAGSGPAVDKDTVKRERKDISQKNASPSAALWCNQVFQHSCNNAQPVPINPEADELKQQGDRHLAQNQFQSALEFYNEALEKQCNPEYLAQRAAAYFGLKQFELAQLDAKAAVEFNSSVEPNLQAALWLLRSSICLGDAQNGDVAVTLLRNHHRRTDISKEEMELITLKMVSEEIDALIVKKEFRTVVVLCGRALNIAPGCVTFKLIKAETLLMLDRAVEASIVCSEVIGLDKTCAKGHYIRAFCFYIQGNLEEALDVLEYACHVCAESTFLSDLLGKFQALAKTRTEATEKKSQGCNAEAKKGFLECLRIMEGIEHRSTAIQGRIFQRLSALSELSGDLDTALDWAVKSVTMMPDSLETVVHRAHLYKKKGLFRKAIEDYQTAISLDPENDMYKIYIHQMKKYSTTPKKTPMGAHYRILGISPIATQDEIKIAYKKQALVHHPDKHSHANEEVKKAQEAKFQLIGNAYKILSNVTSRRDYDMALRRQHFIEDLQHI